MFAVDTNVLIYAANASCDEHSRCRELVETWRGGATPWYLTWNIIYEFVRVTTHERVFAQPWSTGEAWTFIAGLLASPQLSLLQQTSRHAQLAREIADELPDIQGNLIHDSHTAVLMLEHGIKKIYTRDTDFHRFPFLEIIDPLR